MSVSDEMLEALTPEALKRVALQIAKDRETTARTTIAVRLIAECLLSEWNFDSERERQQALRRTEQKIARLSSQTDGLRYIENE